MKKFPLNTLTVAMLLAVAGRAAAAGSEEADLAMAYGDKDFVMIATGSKTPINKAPSVASVITADDIKAMGATTLEQVLETVPGVHVSYNGNQWLPLYYIRGIATQYNPEVLVMVNGIPITDQFVGDRGRMWGDYPLENISRVEVIRGPGSALYGAEAVAGVINIITKKAGEIGGTEAGVRAGKFDTYDAWAQHGGNWGGFDVATYLRLGKTAGSDAIVGADAQTSLDRTYHTNVSHAPGPLNAGYDAVDLQLDLSRDKWRFRSSLRDRSNYGTGTGVADALDPSTKMHGRYITSDLTWQDPEFGRNLGLTVQASYYDIAETNTEITLFPAGSVLPVAQSGGSTSTVGMVGQPQHWIRSERLHLSALYTGFERHKLQYGAGLNQDDMYKVTETKNFNFSGGVPTCLNLACSMVDVTGSSTLAFLTPHKRDAYYAYVQDEWSLARDWTLTGGVRYDRYSDVGGTTNPRLALVWDTAYNLTSKLMYGRAFRAPSFVELYTINNPEALGNPNLKPETIDTLELAFSWQVRDDIKTGLNLFHYRMKDVIKFMPNAVASSGNTAQNAGGQHGNGLELEARWEATSTLALSGNYAYQRSIDESTGKDAGLAPHHLLYGRVDWRYAPGWTLNGQVNYVADRLRPSGDTRAKIADYATVDLTLRTDRLRDGWEAAFSVRNLFNAEASEPTTGSSATNLPYDLPLPGRSYYLELRYKL